MHKMNLRKITRFDLFLYICLILILRSKHDLYIIHNDIQMIFCVFILISKIILNRIITPWFNTQQHHRLKHLISRLLYIFISYLKKEGRHSLVNGHKNDKILNFFLWDEWQRLFYRSIYHSSNFHFYLPSFSHIFGLSRERETHCDKFLPRGVETYYSI